MKTALSCCIFLALAGIAPAQTVKDSSLVVTQIVSDLDTPTTMAFIGTDDFLVLSKNSGQVRRVTGGVLQAQPVLDVDVDNCDEHGLLGIAVHPNFPTPPAIYLYFTESAGPGDSCSPLGNRIYRYDWAGSALTNGVLLIDLPAASANHNGGVIAFGPDGKLYAVIGDQNQTGQLQNFPTGAPDDTSIILRFNDDGSTPGDNPFPSQAGMTNVFAYGVRNSFGLAFDPVAGNLWDTENGAGNYDEINLVLPGFNSGWRDIMGPLARTTSSTNNLFLVPGAAYADPKFSWHATVAPTGLTFLNSTQLGAQYENDLFVGDFNNGFLYRFTPNQARTGLALAGNLADAVADSDNERNAVEFGSGFGGAQSGITDVKVGPDGKLYVLSIGAGKVWVIYSSPFHDLALASIKPPKKITLTDTKPSQTKTVKVQIQNLTPHSETIPDLATLSNLVTLAAESLGACPAPSAQLLPPKKGFPITLASKKKLTVLYDVTYDCANDPAKGTGHEDYRYTASVTHAALDGNADTAPGNDTCPRDPSGSDKGCGAKKPDKTLGGDVLTDVFVK